MKKAFSYSSLTLYKSSAPKRKISSSNQDTNVYFHFKWKFYTVQVSQIYEDTRREGFGRPDPQNTHKKYKNQKHKSKQNLQHYYYSQKHQKSKSLYKRSHIVNRRREGKEKTP